MFMLKLVILYLTPGFLEYFNNTRGILNFGRFIATIIEFRVCNAIQDVVVMKLK